MTHFFEDKDGMRAEVMDNGRFYNVTFDDLHLGNPKELHCASVLVPKDEAAEFLAALAAQFGLGILEHGLVKLRDLPTTAVQVYDNSKNDWFTPGENLYTISGDVHDFLSDDEITTLTGKWRAARDKRGADSANYMVQDLALKWAEKDTYEFDSESGCFFAYTDDKKHAEDLAQWINDKVFLR